MASLTTRTRLLIISDTHGVALFDERDLESEDPNNPCAMKNLFRKMGANLPHDFKRPLPTADIAIHCGDLTMSSTLDEFKITFDLMREIDAPLKLVIPGNHDGSLHPAFWEEKVSPPFDVMIEKMDSAQMVSLFLFSPCPISCP